MGRCGSGYWPNIASAAFSSMRSRSMTAWASSHHGSRLSTVTASEPRRRAIPAASGAPIAAAASARSSWNTARGGPSAITRLLELGIPAYLIRATVLGVMAQRLLRLLCPHCKTPATIDPEVWNRLVAPWKARPPATVYAATGCLECRNTGYTGRQGIYEILRVDSTLARSVRDNCDSDELRTIGMRAGMQTLRLAGARKIAAGITTLEEVLRVAPPETMREGT